MTRFARARGSKASNERVPEQATPWSVMKQQFLCGRRDNFSVQGGSTSTVNSDILSGSWTRNASAQWTQAKQQQNNNFNDRVENSSGGKHESIYNQSSKIQSSPVWDDFGGVKKKKNNNFDVLKKVSNGSKDLKKIKNKKKVTKFSVKDTIVETATLSLQSATVSAVPEKNNAGKKKRENTETKVEGSNIINLQPFDKNREVNKESSCESGKTKNNTNNLRVPVNFSNSNSKKRNVDKEIVEESSVKFESSKNYGFNNFNNFEKQNDSFESLKNNKFSGNCRRNHFDDYPDTMIIGGNVVEIGEFQGFPVKKEDEVRLKSLRKDLQAKGVPRKEIEYVLKGERRRAEKALAREKKLACFNCRRFGHNVAECPELGDQTEVGKVCFKCGSTEHKYTDCRVVPEKDAFRFAECFICKEQGHISRQCPDNPRGLYPKGGGCKVCGSVTHLKKDCPELVTEKEISAVTVGTVDESSVLEALDEEVTNSYSMAKTPTKKKRKVVKF